MRIFSKTNVLKKSLFFVLLQVEILLLLQMVQKMAAQTLWIVGSLIYLLLGAAHLYYTFFTDKFLAKNPDTVAGMQNTHPLVTRKTTMWKAWVGFNGSHSLGAIFLGIINLILAGQYFHILAESGAMLSLTFLTSIFYLFLAKKYWFNIPLNGIVLATCCFGVAMLLMRYS